MPDVKKVSNLLEGQKATVISLNNEHPAAYRLQELGLFPGAPIQFIRKAPLGDPIEIKVRSSLLILRKEEAELISVRS